MLCFFIHFRLALTCFLLILCTSRSLLQLSSTFSFSSLISSSNFHFPIPLLPFRCSLFCTPSLPIVHLPIYPTFSLAASFFESCSVLPHSTTTFSYFLSSVSRTFFKKNKNKDLNIQMAIKISLAAAKI